VYFVYFVYFVFCYRMFVCVLVCMCVCVYVYVPGCILCCVRTLDGILVLRSLRSLGGFHAAPRSRHRSYVSGMMIVFVFVGVCVCVCVCVFFFCFFFALTGTEKHFEGTLKVRREQ
jgi:hypothetical protein